MLKPLAALCLLAYFLSGTLLLPQGDFAALADLPSMYRHCRATEDKDMTPFDFVTDHLVNIDGLFDKHDHGDEQKPHAPFAFRHAAGQAYFTCTPPRAGFASHWTSRRHDPCSADPVPLTEYVSDIFRPPMA